mmetsp:Transcript_25030/g.63902  ORF Transcript_25030/g.63902 Transcript_25030/m.63902 type:complete len:554 (-) Transcript_25030:26-1687(-)
MSADPLEETLVAHPEQPLLPVASSPDEPTDKGEARQLLDGDDPVQEQTLVGGKGIVADCKVEDGADGAQSRSQGEDVLVQPGAEAVGAGVQPGAQSVGAAVQDVPESENDAVQPAAEDNPSRPDHSGNNSQASAPQLAEPDPQLAGPPSPPSPQPNPSPHGQSPKDATHTPTRKTEAVAISAVSTRADSASPAPVQRYEWSSSPARMEAGRGSQSPKRSPGSSPSHVDQPRLGRSNPLPLLSHAGFALDNIARGGRVREVLPASGKFRMPTPTRVGRSKRNPEFPETVFLPRLPLRAANPSCLHPFVGNTFRPGAVRGSASCPDLPGAGGRRGQAGGHKTVAWRDPGAREEAFERASHGLAQLTYGVADAVATQTAHTRLLSAEPVLGLEATIRNPGYVRYGLFLPNPAAAAPSGGVGEVSFVVGGGELRSYEGGASAQVHGECRPGDVVALVVLSATSVELRLRSAVLRTFRTSPATSGLFAVVCPQLATTPVGPVHLTLPPAGSGMGVMHGSDSRAALAAAAADRPLAVRALPPRGSLKERVAGPRVVQVD